MIDYTYNVFIKVIDKDNNEHRINKRHVISAYKEGENLVVVLTSNMKIILSDKEQIRKFDNFLDDPTYC